jgi:hypothetical protein
MFHEMFHAPEIAGDHDDALSSVLGLGFGFTLSCFRGFHIGI